MKITLANLSEATEQQVFDQVAEHLLTQNAMSMDDENVCKYRSPAGLMCAAGCLIADNEYLPEWENNIWRDLVHRQVVPAKHLKLISALQDVHDDAVSPDDSPDELHATWLVELEEVARANNLIWSF